MEKINIYLILIISIVCSILVSLLTITLLVWQLIKKGKNMKEKIQQAYEQMILEKIEATKKLPVESISIELLKALQDAVEIISKDYCRDFLS